MSNHPITPPPELVREWCAHSNKYETYDQFWNHIATEAAQWGSDQELEACCEWLVRNYNYPEAGNPLRTARRPKPPTLKEQALEALGADGYSMLAGKRLEPVQLKIIRRAIEALPND